MTFDILIGPYHCFSGIKKAVNIRSHAHTVHLWILSRKNSPLSNPTYLHIYTTHIIYLFISLFSLQQFRPAYSCCSSKGCSSPMMNEVQYRAANQKRHWLHISALKPVTKPACLILWLVSGHIKMNYEIYLVHKPIKKRK